MILVADGHCIHWSRRRKMFVVNTEKAEMNCESQIVNDENDICLSTIRKPRGHRTLQTPTVMKSKPCFGNGVLPQRTKCWHFQGKWTKPDVWKRGKGADSKGRVPCTFSHVGKSGEREKQRNEEEEEAARGRGNAGGRQRGDGMDVIQSTVHTCMKIWSKKLQTPSVRNSFTEALTPAWKSVITFPLFGRFGKLGYFSDWELASLPVPLW